MGPTPQRFKRSRGVGRSPRDRLRRCGGAARGICDLLDRQQAARVVAGPAEPGASGSGPWAGAEKKKTLHLLGMEVARIKMLVAEQSKLAQKISGGGLTRILPSTEVAKSTFRFELQSVGVYPENLRWAGNDLAFAAVAFVGAIDPLNAQLDVRGAWADWRFGDLMAAQEKISDAGDALPGQVALTGDAMARL